MPWNINLPDNRAETGPNDGALAFSRWEEHSPSGTSALLESRVDEFKYLVREVDRENEILVNYEKQFDYERTEGEIWRKSWKGSNCN